MVNTREYNQKRFSIYDSEEKTALGLMKELGDVCNNVLDRTDKVEKDNNKKVSYEELHNNYQLTTDGKNANFNGSWQGLNKPTLTQEGAAAQVEKNMEDIVNILNEVNSISFFPRLHSETDDYNRILRALNNTKTGGVIKFPTNNYDLNGNDIIINKGITIIGDGIDKTIFSGGSIQIESNNVNISDLTVLALSKQNAFQCNNGEYGNIRITRCKGSAIDHSFLFESYNGTVQNIICDDCISVNSIHGFISKAYDVTFKNCRAYNHYKGFGFGTITDNIPSSTQIGACSYNKIINCEAYNCSSGVRAYCRDKYDSDTTLKCKNNTINGFKAIKCNTPISIGEDIIPEGYKAISSVDYYLILGVFVEQTVNGNPGIKLAKTYRCMVDNCIMINGIEQTINATDNIIGNVISDTTYTNTSAIPLIGNTIINTSLNNNFEIFLTSGTSTTDKITLTGTPKNGGLITVLVRNGGFNSFGGFDTSNLIIDTTKFTINTNSYTFNHGQVTQWLWLRGLSKWLCIYASDIINLS